MEVFGTSGYNATSLAQVAAAMGMTHTGLHHHFQGKERLLEAVLARLDDDTRLPPQTKGPARGREFLANILLRYEHAEPDLKRAYCVLAAEATSPNHPAHEHFQRGYRLRRAEVIAALREFPPGGESASELGIRGLASRLLAVADGLLLQSLTEPGSVDVEGQVLTAVRTAVPQTQAFRG
ncbi:TetR/AcrR family transcriptional regulator [Pseudoclavibacter terrae]|uniref:TetR/AcrR family transcriptional regulator n=1 Tax=Pseudoclavibacter terrae TaxID=1530195 RepID=UPI003A5C81F8